MLTKLWGPDSSILASRHDKQEEKRPLLVFKNWRNHVLLLGVSFAVFSGRLEWDNDRREDFPPWRKWTLFAERDYARTPLLRLHQGKDRPGEWLNVFYIAFRLPAFSPNLVLSLLSISISLPFYWPMSLSLYLSLFCFFPECHAFWCSRVCERWF